MPLKTVWEGERNPKAKLTAEDVRYMRRLHAIGVSNKELQKEFNLSKAQTAKILNRTCWVHV